MQIPTRFCSGRKSEEAGMPRRPRPRRRRRKNNISKRIQPAQEKQAGSEQIHRQARLYKRETPGEFLEFFVAFRPTKEVF